ncbi:Os05g0457000, partial [Oryza sativa Japonica Group]
PTAARPTIHHHSTSAAMWDHCTSAPPPASLYAPKTAHIHRQLFPRAEVASSTAGRASRAKPASSTGRAPRANPASLHRPRLSRQTGLHLRRSRLSRRAGLCCHRLRLSVPSRPPTPPLNTVRRRDAAVCHAPASRPRLPCLPIPW